MLLVGEEEAELGAEGGGGEEVQVLLRHAAAVAHLRDAIQRHEHNAQHLNARG